MKQGLLLGGLILGLGATAYVVYTKIARKNEDIGETEEA